MFIPLATLILTELWIIFTTTLACYGIAKHYQKIQNTNYREIEKKKRKWKNRLKRLSQDN